MRNTDGDEALVEASAMAAPRGCDGVAGTPLTSMEIQIPNLRLRVVATTFSQRRESVRERPGLEARGS